jgi:Fic family protein
VTIFSKNLEQELQIIPTSLLEDYLQQLPQGLQQAFDELHDAEISTDAFSFYTSVSAMASSKIEGEPMEIDSYVKHKMLNIEYMEDLVQKPNDLYNAYLFAQKNELSQKNFLQAHKLITAHLLPLAKRGKLRTGNMVVMKHQTFRIQFEAALATEVKSLCALLWKDIEALKKQELNLEGTLFFASLIHLVFVNIHPFEDGNGRAGRLLEKWFISQMLGEKAWYIQSELNYYRNINNYYKNLNRLGVFYEQLDYSKALPFLLMLPQSLFLNQQEQ